MYLNKAIIVGNLTRDPELKALPSGVSVCSFSVATNKVTTKDGVKNEKTEYHNIIAFGKTGQNIATYMKKGNQIMIEGEIQTRNWEDKNGVKQYRTEILATNVQFGSKNSTTGQNNANMTTSDQEQGDYGNGVDSVILPESDINPEDIPF